MFQSLVRSTVSTAALVVFLAAPVAAEELTPEETVKQYMKAVQDLKFERAYDLVSKGMRHDKTKEVWVKEQQYIMNFAEAKIFDFKVLPGKIEGDKATVPNVLSSQDKFLNQLALEENELYTLIKEDGAWKIDQQSIAEGAELKKFFPQKPPQP